MPQCRIQRPMTWFFRGIRKACTSASALWIAVRISSRKPASRTSSVSICSTHSCRHWATDQFFCFAELMYSCWIMRAPYSRQISRVWSALKESTTRISSAHLTDSSVSRTVAAELNVGRRTEIDGFIGKTLCFGRLFKPHVYQRPDEPNRQCELRQHFYSLSGQQPSYRDE